MVVKESEITAKGHSLLAKVLAGVELKFTAVLCGDGDFSGDIWDLDELVSQRLEGEFVKVIPNPKERYTSIIVRFTNENVQELFQLKEIGIYALDPDEGEILYAYANAGERANFIEAYNGKWYTEDELDLQIYTASTTNISARIVKSEDAVSMGYDNSKSGLESDNVQNAIDEISSLYPINRIITHNLQTYPYIYTVEFSSGYGAANYDDCLYGGSNGHIVRNSVEYMDRESLQIFVGKNYGAVKEIERTNKYEYIVTFVDSTLILLVRLIAGMGAISAESEHLSTGYGN